MSIFNPILYGVGNFIVAAGSGAEASSWAARPELGTEGDFLLITSGPATGFLARWSDVWEDWIPAQAYDAGIALDGRIDGDVIPSAETPAWTHVVSGGTITAPGGYVQFSANDAQTAYATLSHGINNGNHLMSGIVGSFAPSGTGEDGIFAISTGSKLYRFVMGDALGAPGFFDGSLPEGFQDTSLTLSGETDFQLFIAFYENQFFAWAPDLRAWPIATIPRLGVAQAGSGQLYYVGDLSTNGGATFTIKNFKAGRFLF